MMCADLNRLEQFSGGAFLPVAICSKSEKVLFVAMDSKVSIEQFEALCEMAVSGAKKISQFMESVMRENVQNQLV